MSRLLPGLVLAVAVAVAVAVACAACGAAPPTETGPTESDCEPGRCLGDISRTIGEHRMEARACYRSKQPGQLVMNFEIDADGNVLDTSQGMQDGQIEDPGVVACVGDVVKKIKFPKSAAGKTTRGYHRFEFAGR